MKKDDISPLLQRYLSARQSEKEPYFDADEIDELLNSFEESEDYTYYDELLGLGMKLHPGNTDLQLKYCKQLIFNEDYNQALALIDTFGETDNPDPEMLRLECFCALGHYFEKVVPYVENRIAANYEFTENIFEYLASLLNDLDLLHEADHLINWGLCLYPDNLLLKDEFCFTLEAENKIPEAIKVCNELIDKNPFSFDYWFALGRLYALSTEYEKAIDAFDFALTCEDTSKELKLLRAYCLYMNESYELAIEAYEELQANDAIYTYIQPILADCHTELGHFEKGYSILHELYEKDAKVMYEEPAIYTNLLKCCMETDRREEISTIIHKAFERFPDNPEILTSLGYDQLLETKPDQAAIMLERYRQYSKKLSEIPPEDDDASDWDLDIDEPTPWDDPENKPISPEDLVRDFLSNKENKN